MSSVTVEVPGIPPGPNQQSRNRHARARVTAEWRRTASLCASSAMNVIPGRRDESGFPWGRSLIHLTFTFGQSNTRDPDNLISTVKPLIDGLIDAGLIVNDTSRHVSYAPPEVRVVRGRTGVSLRVERVAAPVDGVL